MSYKRPANAVPLERPDVYIIQKQTTLERYSSETSPAAFENYLRQDEKSAYLVKKAHEEHERSREKLLTYLKNRGVSWQLYNLDELKKQHTSFYLGTEHVPGLCPRLGLVISLGGDGTLLHTSHHVGASVVLLGINSCPGHSVGHLCAATTNTMESLCDRIWEGKASASISQVRRLQVESTSQKSQLPLVLNDILISHAHPAASSRYQISIYNKLDFPQKIPKFTEKQTSSGLWIATATGRTAAISCYGFVGQDILDHHVLLASRELYLQPGLQPQLQTYLGNGNTEVFEIFSRMRHGLICADGPDFSVPFGFGDQIKMTLPEYGILNLVK